MCWQGKQERKAVKKRGNTDQTERALDLPPPVLVTVPQVSRSNDPRGQSERDTFWGHRLAGCPSPQSGWVTSEDLGGPIYLPAGRKSLLAGQVESPLVPHLTVSWHEPPPCLNAWGTEAGEPVPP